MSNKARSTFNDWLTTVESKNNVSEQTALGGLTRVAMDPSNVSTPDFIGDTDYTKKTNTTSKERVKELFNTAKELNKELAGTEHLLSIETLDRIDDDIKILEDAMTGLGTNGTTIKNVLKRIKNIEELAYLIERWRCPKGHNYCNTHNRESLLSWFEGEYSLKWSTIWSGLSGKFANSVSLYKGGIIA